MKAITGAICARHRFSRRGWWMKKAMTAAEAAHIRMRTPSPPTTVSQAKLVRRLGDLAADDLIQVEDAVRNWLGL
jgi:hypothetical protein